MSLAISFYLAFKTKTKKQSPKIQKRNILLKVQLKNTHSVFVSLIELQCQSDKQFLPSLLKIRSI